MKYQSTEVIQNELVNIVSNFYRENNIVDLDTISQYRMINEVVHFLFEDYRDNFEHIVKHRYNNELSKDQLRIEGLLFTAWVTISTMKEIRASVAPYNGIGDHAIK